MAGMIGDVVFSVYIHLLTLSVLAGSVPLHSFILLLKYIISVHYISFTDIKSTRLMVKFTE